MNWPFEKGKAMDETTICTRVHDYYWQNDDNCATVTLKILAEKYGLTLDDQVLDAAVGMHGAGGYRAQCGLVEGALLFLGIVGRARGIPDQELVALCRRFAGGFEETFSSLLCRELRPEGFADDLPEHLCEQLSARAVIFSARFVDEALATHC